MASDPTTAMVLAYEEGRAASPGERGLILLAVAAPELTVPARAALPVGRRDALLLDLHERLFGGRAEALADCPRCSEKLETDVLLAAIRAPTPVDAPARFTLTIGAREIGYRLPNAGDLAALGANSELSDGTAATRALARRCLLALEDSESLSDEAEAALTEAIANAVTAADPQAEVMLELECPGCGFHWTAPFDIVEFLWRRLESTVSTLLREVHIIASHYGWSERDILTLSPFRRRRYLELVGI
ncbi:MAG: hypothetical protein HYS06_07175 [Methylocystis sp.]|nr:hypothetical protein [Methylocystis sp.]